MSTKQNDLPGPIKNVPQSDVRDTAQSLIDNDDVIQLKVKQQADGRFTITPEKQSS